MKIASTPLNNKNVGFCKKYCNTDKMLNALGEQIGEGAKKNLIKKIEQANCKNSSLIYDAKNNIIEISDNSSKKISKSLIDTIINLPLDITNSCIDALNKTKFAKKSKFLANISNSKLLKTRKLNLENSANIASIEKCLNSFDGEKFNDDFFKNVHSRLSLKVGNYDSSNEKALTRLCTGIVPAFFLANDAYNLSMYVSNNKKNAENTHKRRFKQEMTRIGITSASMFLALKSVSKTSNKNPNAVTSIIAGVTILSEIIGRKIAGNPIWFISKQSDIEKYAKKRGQKPSKVKTNSSQESKKENILNAKNILKVLGIMLVAGFSVDKISKIPTIQKMKNKFLNSYDNFMKKDYKISKAEFEDLLNVLKKNGFEGLADKYGNIAKNQAVESGNNLILGKVTNKAKYVPIHQVLTFPLRYAWGIVNFPYSKIVRPIADKITHKEVKKIKKPTTDLDVLRDSLNIIKKIKNKDNFSEILNKKLLSSLDYETKSSVSNAGLSVKTKKVASIASSTFLIADNYNSVMIESNGDNKDLAVQKGKERAIQRIVRIIYGTFFTTLFNTIFESTYNSSLLGAQVVNVADSFVLETMERKAVGLPTKKSNKQDIILLEQEYLTSNGIKGYVSRLMAKITGKKPITQRTN